MKIYPLLIACTLAIATNSIADNAKANNQFNKVNVSSDQKLNVNYKEIIKKFSKELRSFIFKYVNNALIYTTLKKYSK